MPRIQQALGLQRLPHFTTVQKAFERLSTPIWRVLQRISAALLQGDADKGYDDQTHRNRLRSCGKRPLIKHREFKPYDKAANTRIDRLPSLSRLDGPLFIRVFCSIRAAIE